MNSILFCDGQRGTGAQRPFGQVNKPKNKGARSARVPSASETHQYIILKYSVIVKIILSATFVRLLRNLKKLHSIS
jgi:hypothetical protein